MKRSFNDKAANFLGRQGVFLIGWGVMCVGLTFTIDTTYPWNSDSGVFYTNWPISAREAIWAIAGLFAFLAAFSRKPKLHAMAFAMIAVALAQRISGYLLAAFAWLAPGPPVSSPTSIGWTIFYSALLWLLWLTAETAPTKDDERRLANVRGD